MPLNFVENMAANLRKPTSGFYGRLVRLNLSLSNRPLEKNAVKLLKIEPQHQVLEIGFGPGLGIKYVMNGKLRSGTGKLTGVDFSEAVCTDARRRFSKEISNGKLEIINADVVAMDLPDSHFDKVFHTNSHLYWPDLPRACEELHRVMKTGADLVTVMNLIRLEKVTKRLKISKHVKNSKDEYIDALGKSGFVDIDVVEIKRSLATSLHAIVCKK